MVARAVPRQGFLCQPGVTSSLEAAIHPARNATRSIVPRLGFVPQSITADAQSISDPQPCLCVQLGAANSIGLDEVSSCAQRWCHSLHSPHSVSLSQREPPGCSCTALPFLTASEAARPFLGINELVGWQSSSPWIHTLELRWNQQTWLAVP